MKTLTQTMEECMDLIKDLGSHGKINPPALSSQTGKRACLAEQVVYNYLVKNFGDGNYLMVEGFENHGNPNSNTKIIADPLDGTVYYARQKSVGYFPTSIALSKINGNLNYQNIEEVAVGNLQTGEIWYAGEKGVVYSNKMGICRVGKNEEHDPVLATDFHFPENAEARLKLTHPKNPEWDRFECLNAGSVAIQIAQVACGDLDGFYNLVGPTVHEIVPRWLLTKNAGGFVLDPISGKEIKETDSIKVEGRIPVIFAKDENLAQQIYEQTRGII